jgi:hypothetical protein
MKMLIIVFENSVIEEMTLSKLFYSPSACPSMACKPPETLTSALSEMTVSKLMSILKLSVY